ncbi:MAG: VOC family protein [Pyrinomonadaceae bacterium]
MLENAIPVTLLNASDPGSLREFYEDVLGLGFLSEDPGGVVFSLGSGVLRILKSSGAQEKREPVLSWKVTDIGLLASKLRSKGVEPIPMPCFENGENGICISKSAKHFFFCDPSGNLLSLIEPFR